MSQYEVVLFTYNRPESTKQTLHALQRNNIKKIHIFQDGLKKEEHRTKWEATRKVIEECLWCDVIYELSSVNRGLADSVCYGIDKVFQDTDRVIVLEDDCVVSDDFISFMELCFEKYEKNKSVMSITGYAWPIAKPSEYKYSAYANKRISSWGWGTWKDRWHGFSRDYNLLKTIKKSPLLLKDLEMYGCDLEDMLVGNLLGKCDTWAAFWALYVIACNGISINSVKNRVSNIGFKDSGVHAKGHSVYEMPIQLENNEDIYLPDDVTPQKWAEDGMYKNLHNELGNSYVDKLTYYRITLEKWVAIKQQGKSVSGILLAQGISEVDVFGTGSIAKLLIDEIKTEIDIRQILVTDVTVDKFEGIPVRSICDNIACSDTIVIIPGFDKCRVLELNSEIEYKNVYGIEELMSAVISN